MDRRGFIARLFGAAIAIPAFGEAKGTYGPVTPDRWDHLDAHGIHLRIVRHGQDVSKECTFCDDTPGSRVARLLKRKRHPKTGLYTHYLNSDGEVATEDVTDFEIVEGKA
jgi:hypothetical protein